MQVFGSNGLHQVQVDTFFLRRPLSSLIEDASYASVIVTSVVTAVVVAVVTAVVIASIVAVPTRCGRMVDGMLDEVVSSAADRSTEPKLLDRAVVELVCEKKRQQMVDVLALVD